MSLSDESWNSRGSKFDLNSTLERQMRIRSALIESDSEMKYISEPDEYSSSSSDRSVEEITSKLRSVDPISESKPSTTEARFAVVKTNRYGRKQDRILMVDHLNGLICVLDSHMRLKKEFSARQLYGTENLPMGDKNDRCTRIIFVGTQRPYDLEFLTVDDKLKFDSVAQRLKSDTSTYKFETLNRTNDFKTLDGRLNNNANTLHYEVFKENKYGLKQFRVLVVEVNQGMLRVVDGKGKCKKVFSAAEVKGVEFLSTKENKEPRSAMLVFGNDQRPFTVHFNDSAELLDFQDQLKAMQPNIISTTSASAGLSGDSVSCYNVVKINRVGVRKRRILYVDTQKKAIHSVVSGQRHKSIPAWKLQSIQRAVNDKRGLSLRYAADVHMHHLIFENSELREKFFRECRSMMHLHDCQDDSEQHCRAFNRTGDDLSWKRGDSLHSTCIRGGGDGGRGMGGGDDVSQMTNSQSMVSLFVGTWNVGNSQPIPTSLDVWIPIDKDIYVFGLQECKKSHRDQWVQCIDAKLSSAEMEDQTGKLYVTFNVVWMWEIVVLLYVRRKVAHLISNLRTATEKTGIAARQERLEQRKENYHKIVRGLQLGSKQSDILNDFHHIIFFGDLNYRIENEFLTVIRLIEEQDWEELELFDQLIMERNCKAVLIGFKEGALRFPPSYRTERDRIAYSNKRDQAPSWTDRILYLSLPGCEDEIDQFTYNTAHYVLGSDHRPVYSEFVFKPRLCLASNAPRNEQNQPIIEFVRISFAPVNAVHSTKDQLLLAFSANFLEDNVKSKPGLTGIHNSRPRWMWNQTQLSPLLPFVHDLDYMRAQHVFVTLYEQDDSGGGANTIGYAVVTLRGLFQTTSDQPEPFSSHVTKHGELVGKLKGYVIGRLKGSTT